METAKETIKEGHDMVYSRNSQLPFPLPEERTWIGRGSTSEVYVAYVEPGYFEYKESDNRNYYVSSYFYLSLKRSRLPFCYLVVCLDSITDDCTSHSNRSRK